MVKVYVVDCLVAPSEYSWRYVTDDQFKRESQNQGKAYTFKDFQEAFNNEIINSNVDIIRII
tara:strand:+ start:130 stop:315 length:186 start_codon:yes stop_codon:yes gene_type:complete